MSGGLWLESEPEPTFGIGYRHARQGLSLSGPAEIERLLDLEIDGGVGNGLSRIAGNATRQCDGTAREVGGGRGVECYVESTFFVFGHLYALAAVVSLQAEVARTLFRQDKFSRERAVGVALDRTLGNFPVGTVQLNRLALAGDGTTFGSSPRKDDAGKMQGVAGTVYGAVGKERGAYFLARWLVIVGRAHGQSADRV